MTLHIGVAANFDVAAHQNGAAGINDLEWQDLMTRVDIIPLIIEELYAGVLDFPLWDRAILRIVDLVGGAGAALLAFNPKTGAVLRHEQHRVNPRLFVDYHRDGWDMRDVRIPAGVSVATGSPITERHILSMRTFERSEVYSDFLLPYDCPHFLATWLFKSSEKMMAFSIQGTLRRGSFNDEERNRILPLVPHLQRALALRDRLDAADVRARALVSCLDRVNFGLITLDERGRVLEANTIASALIGSGAEISRDSRGILILRGMADADLKHHILRRVPASTTRNGIIHVARPRASPLTIVVAALSESAQQGWGATAHARWLVFIFDPERRVELSTEALSKDMGLTEREAQIVSLLAGGLTIEQVAARLNRSVHTVRTHLKAIYGKTGLRNQRTVVYRALCGAASIGTTMRSSC